MTTADQTLNDACHEAIATIRFGRKVGRAVPTTVLAMALQIAVEEAAPAHARRAAAPGRGLGAGVVSDGCVMTPEGPCHDGDQWTCLGCERDQCQRCDGIPGSEFLCWACASGGAA